MKTGKEMAQYTVKRSASRQGDTTQHTSGSLQGTYRHIQSPIKMYSLKHGIGLTQLKYIQIQLKSHLT